MASNHQVVVKVIIRNLWLVSVFFALLVISFQISGTECRKVKIESEVSVTGEWPFIVIVKETETSKFVCPGTLISKKHILTAAYCIYNYSENRTRSAEDIVVFLGTSTNEERVVRANVTKFHVHPDWSRKRNSGDANLAILVLSADVTFTDYISPARLPAADDVAINSSTVDVVGTAAGWFRFTKDLTITQASVRTLNCDKTNPAFGSTDRFSFHPETDRIFCCKYENLGGFFVRSDDTWVQYGLLCVIRRVPLAEHDVVAVYTNIKLFTNWIAETIELSESGAVNQTGFVSGVY